MRRGLCVMIGMLILMVDGYDLQSIGFVATDIAKSWSMDLGTFGRVFAAGVAGSIPGALFAGSVARWIGQQRSLALALAVFGLGSLASAYATSLAGLVVIRFVLGLGLGACVPLVLTLVGENAPRSFRSTLSTLALCGQPLGAVVGAAGCARWVPLFGWPVVFQVGGLLPLLLLPAVGVFAHRGRPESDSPAEPPAIAQLLGSGLALRTFALCATSFMAATLVYVMANWLPGTVRAEGGSLRESMWAIGLFNFGGITGAIFQGVLSDRFGPKRTAAPAFILGMLSIGLIESFRNVSAVLLSGAALAGFAAYGATISLGPLALLSYPAALRTMGTGWVLGIGRLGGVASPLLVGAMLLSGMSPSYALYVAAGAAGLAGLGLMLLFGSCPGIAESTDLRVITR